MSHLIRSPIAKEGPGLCVDFVFLSLPSFHLEYFFHLPWGFTFDLFEENRPVTLQHVPCLACLMLSREWTQDLHFGLESQGNVFSLLSQQCPTTLICPFTGDVHFDPWVNVLSAGSPPQLRFPFVTNEDLL